MLSLVLPKGSLERATLDLFDAADLTVRRSSDRDYHASIDDPRIDKVRFLRPQEIPSYLERGLFDLGITGRDWITETEADVVSLGELQYSKATSQPVRVVLAVPDSTSWQSVADLPEGVRISTEFPSLTRRFLDARGVKAMVIPSYGATEAKVPDIVDAIVDLTETGSSLRKNGLRVLETLLTSYTELIASGPAFADPQKRAAMEDIALLLRGAIQARGNVLLKLNVVADRLAAVTEMLPSLSSPTITTLARGDMNAVETVVPKRGVNTLIPALKAAGAQDILEIPISKIVELAVAPWRRHTARVLPVDADGRVLLLHGWDPRHPDRPFWFTIGGAAEAGESLRDAGARELREETGIVIDPACLGEPIAQNTVEFSWAGYQITQDQTFYAVRIESAEVTLDGMDSWERATTDKYGWLSADDLGPDMPPADPSLPGLIRAAAVSVRDRRPSGS
jgi:ATP phosphoribosyltransferase